MCKLYGKIPVDRLRRRWTIVNAILEFWGWRELGLPSGP